MLSYSVFKGVPLLMVNKGEMFVNDASVGLCCAFAHYSDPAAAMLCLQQMNGLVCPAISPTNAKAYGYRVS